MYYESRLSRTTRRVVDPTYNNNCDSYTHFQKFMDCTPLPFAECRMNGNELLYAGGRAALSSARWRWRANVTSIVQRLQLHSVRAAAVKVWLAGVAWRGAPLQTIERVSRALARKLHKITLQDGKANNFFLSLSLSLSLFASSVESFLNDFFFLPAEASK